MPGVETIRDLHSASRAIDLIVEQGEGSPADHYDSHYRRFQAVKREYTALLAENPHFEPAYRAAENPVMRRPPEPEGKVFINAEPAALILDLTNAVYGMLLRFLYRLTRNPLRRPHRKKSRCYPPRSISCTSWTSQQKLWQAARKSRSP